MAAFAVVVAGVAVPWYGKRAAGETGMELRRRESLRLVSAYVASAEFESECVEPFRTAFRIAAKQYTDAPSAVVEGIVRHAAPLATDQAGMFTRLPARQPKNYAIEILRNAREHLAHRGYNLRAVAERKNFQAWFETVAVGERLILLEKRFPGICPESFPQAIPATRDVLARAIARNLEVTLPEMGELLLGAFQISEERKRAAGGGAGADAAAK